MTRDLVTTGTDNLRRTAVTFADHVPGGETRQFGPVTAAATGTPIPVFNRVLVFDHPPPDEVAAAVAWMAERDVPFLVTVTEDAIDPVANRAPDMDVVKTDESEPGMVLDSLDEIPEREPVVAITAASDPADLDEFCSVFADVFGIPPDVARELTPDSFLADDEIDVFVGRVDERPVACGLLVRSGEAAGVYSIGVVEGFRRRGIGEAMTWEALSVGREHGCQVGVLQSSEMGYSVYEKMGFEPVVEYHHFEPTA